MKCRTWLWLVTDVGLRCRKVLQNVRHPMRNPMAVKVREPCPQGGPREQLSLATHQLPTHVWHSHYGKWEWSGRWLKSLVSF